MTDDRAEPIEAIPIETAVNPLTSALAWLAVVVVVVGVGSWVWTRWINPPVGNTIARYVSKDAGVVFADPTVAQFTVTFPAAYRTTKGTNQFGTTFTATSTVGDYEFSATKTPEPASTLDNFETALNTLAAQYVVNEKGAELVSQTQPLPLVDTGFKEFVYRRGSTYWRVQFRLLKDRLYTVKARLPNSDPRPFRRLTTSFNALGAR